MVMIPAAMEGAKATQRLGRAAKNAVHGGEHPWRRSAVVVATLGGLAAGFLSTNEAPTTKISNPGKGTIESLTLGPGQYCNAKSVVKMDDVASTYSWKPFKVGPHATVTETMSGPITAQVCIKTKALRHPTIVTGEDGKQKANFTLNASADPAKSDFNLIVYEQDPTKMKFKSDGGNWVKRLGDATLGNFRNQLNVIPALHLKGDEDIFRLLDTVDLFQGYNNLSLKCGPKIVDRLTAAKVPGGNMQSMMIDDILRSVPGKDKPKPTDITFTIHNDGTGLPNQYSTPEAGTNNEPATTVFSRLEQVNNGLEFPSANNMPVCDDIVKEIGQVK